MTVATLFSAAIDTGVTDRERDKWLGLRRKMLTASRTAALFGESPFTNRLELYADMVTDNPPEEIISINSPLFWGKALEEAIFRAAASYYGWRAEYGGQLLQSRKHPYLGATLDGAVNPGADWLVYEGKTTTIFRSKDWNEDEGRAPTHVLIQAQHQLLVTGADVAIVFCLIGGQRPVKIEVQAHPGFHAAIIEESEHFLDIVAKLEPPPADGSKASTRALHRLYPVEDDSAVPLPPESLEWTREFFAISEKLRALNGRRDEIKNMVRQHIGSAAHGILPEPVDGKACWKWGTDAKGSRRILPIKMPPRGVHMLPAARGFEYCDEASSQHADRSTLSKKRRRARR